MDLNILAQMAQNLPMPDFAPVPAEPINVLQAAAPPSPPPPELPKAPKMNAADDEAKPRRRLSLLDTIGRVSDVLAKVGGAEALYQPTLDAREDRELQLADHSRKVQADDIALATAKFNLGDERNELLGQAARGLQAIKQGGGDITAAWPILAQRMGIDPETAAAIGQDLATNPNALEGIIAATTDPKYDQAKYGGSVVYGTDASGKLVAYQPGLGNQGGRNVLPEGVTPIDPTKFVDTGGAQVGYGSRSGNVQRILPKTEKPGGAADRRSRENIARWGNQSRETIAGMKPGAKSDENSASFVATARGNLNELRSIYEDLNKRGALVSPAQSTDKNVIARIRASGIGQVLEGAVGTEAQTKRDRIASIKPGLMQSLAKATGMTGKQLDSNADVKLFMQTVTDPTKSYEANIAAIEGLERFLAANEKKAAPAPKSAPKPKAAGGWKIIGVN
jgi:hypothetical protein